MHPCVSYLSLCLALVFAVSVATLAIASVLLARASAHTAAVHSLVAALAEPAAVAVAWQTATRATVLACSALALGAVDADYRLGANGSQIGPARTARALAIAHIALADAVGAATGAYRPYTDVPMLNGSDAAAVRAAAVSATLDALVALYGAAQQQTLRANATRLLAAIADSPAKAAGVQLGADAARRVLAARADDGSDHAEPPATKYESSLPGRWRRDPVSRATVALGGAWGALVQPFVLESAAQFPCAPPPSLDSSQYVVEYDALLALGGDGSVSQTVRDAAQTRLADAADDRPPRALFAATHDACAECDAAALARTLGVVGVVLADTALAAFDSLYKLLRERPVTAIRNGVRDGNDATAGFPQFLPHGATPPYPSMPSVDAALATAWAEATRANATRAGVARIYAGVNWFSDVANGAAQARQIAQYIAARVYQPIE